MGSVPRGQAAREAYTGGPKPRRVEDLDRYASNSAIFRPASMAASDGG